MLFVVFVFFFVKLIKFDSFPMSLVPELGRKIKIIFSDYTARLCFGNKTLEWS